MEATKSKIKRVYSSFGHDLGLFGKASFTGGRMGEGVHAHVRSRATPYALHSSQDTPMPAHSFQVALLARMRREGSSPWSRRGSTGKAS